MTLEIYDQNYTKALFGGPAEEWGFTVHSEVVQDCARLYALLITFRVNDLERTESLRLTPKFRNIERFRELLQITFPYKYYLMALHNVSADPRRFPDDCHATVENPGTSRAEFHMWRATFGNRTRNPRYQGLIQAFSHSDGRIYR